MKVISNAPVIRKGTEGLKLFIFGKPNIGKTSFASNFPNAVILNTDGNLAEFTTPAYTIKSWAKDVRDSKFGITEENCFVQVVHALLEGDHNFDTIVIDVGSHVYDMCRAWVLAKNGWDHESDGGFGKGYDLVSKAWKDVMLKLFTSEYNVIFIAHESTATIKTPSKELVTPCPDMRDKITTFISGMCQITAQITTRDLVVDGKRTNATIMRLRPENESDPVGNKINISNEYMILEPTYQYVDLCELIESRSQRIHVK